MQTSLVQERRERQKTEFILSVQLSEFLMALARLSIRLSICFLRSSLICLQTHSIICSQPSLFSLNCELSLLIAFQNKLQIMLLSLTFSSERKRLTQFLIDSSSSRRSIRISTISPLSLSIPFNIKWTITNKHCFLTR